jgi:hypothetical protein
VPSNPRQRPSTGRGAALLIALAPLAVTLYGMPYYALGPAERVRHALHPWLKPSGYLGQATGLIGLALFLFLWIYPLRKKYRWLAWTGAVGSWLRVHTVAGLVIPLLVAVHAAWRFTGLIGLGYGAMLTVALSGIVGRYLYVHIPRTLDGAELSREDVAEQRRTLVKRLALTTGRDPAAIERGLMAAVAPARATGVMGVLQRMLLDDFARWRAIRRLRREWTRPPAGIAPLGKRSLDEALELARHELKLAQQVRMLDAGRRVFGYWHVAHRPVAITALVAVLVHVAVAVATGMTWFH